MMASSDREYTVDVVRAEAARFRHPLVLVHGLWTGGWIWSGFAAYLAHRGWDAWVPSMCGASPEQRRACLQEVARDLPAPPILIAHDAGLLTVRACASVLRPPAVVALAPLLSLQEGGTPPLTGLASWSVRIGAHRVAPPRGRAARAFLAGLPDDAVRRLSVDAGSVYRAAIAGTGADAGSSGPGLIVGSAHDQIAPPGALETAARGWRWTFDLHGSTGHFPMLETGFEALADRVHRWLVRTVGEELLLFLDEEDETD